MECVQAASQGRALSSSARQVGLADHPGLSCVSELEKADPKEASDQPGPLQEGGLATFAHPRRIMLIRAGIAWASLGGPACVSRAWCEERSLEHLPGHVFV